MIITEHILEQGLSCKGAYGKKQLELLKVPIHEGFRLIKGWKFGLIGTNIPKEDVKRFIELKDAHIKNSQQMSLFLDG